MTEPTERLSSALADRYQILSRLGEGGMAIVYLAEDLKHDRKVAVKVLRPELAAVLGADRFVQEIKTTANLQHPHILPLFDSGEADSFLYYVMPFIDGETLRAKLDRETQLGIDEAVTITTNVADALDYAHRQGVIHRDIKPENILLHDGRPMVADFGIALAVSAAAGGRMTETGLSLGTPHYMSPEQATAEKDLTARADIYSLGSVLYEMLAGEPPHLGNSAQQIIMKIIADEARPITDLRKSVPPHVAGAVAQSLERLPADRFASAAEFGAALGDTHYTKSTMASGSTRVRSGSNRTAMSLAAAALVFLVAAVWGWTRSPGDEAGVEGWRMLLPLPDSVPLQSGLSLSHDGRLLAYGSDDRIWMRTADSPEPTPVAGTEGGGWPAISPDGSSLAFLRPGVGLFVVPATGGTPREIPGKVELNVTAQWMDDDHLIYSVVAGLMRVSVSSGETELLSPAADVFFISPTVLPEGRGAAFTVVSLQRFDSSYVAVIGPEGGEPVPLMPGRKVQYAHPEHLIVTRDDGSIVVVPFDTRRRRVTGRPVTIASGLDVGVYHNVGTATVSRNGRLVYVSASGLGSPYGELVWVTGDGDATPVFSDWAGHFETVGVSHDNRLAAVGLFTNAGDEIHLRDVATGSLIRYQIRGASLRDPVFAADGAFYFAALGGTKGIFRVAPTGDTEPSLVGPSDNIWVGLPAPSPDGNVIYYTSGFNPDERVVMMARLDSGTVDTLPLPPASWSLQPSPDGRWLAYLTDASGGRETRVRSADLRRTEEWTVSQQTVSSPMLRWAPDGSELYYVAGDSMRAARVSTSRGFRVDSRRGLFSMSGLQPNFDVSSDGRFLMTRLRPDKRPPTEFMMLERWWDLLPEGN
jgi:serine/threonine protein kinase